MPWLLLALVLGGGLLLARSGAGGTDAPSSPTGKTWPSPLTTTSVHEAVTWALAHETDAGRLRLFAGELYPFDHSAAEALTLRAAVLDAPQSSPLGQYVPSQVGPSTTAQQSTFPTGILSRRL
jgi:hypothetical protein